MVHSGVRPDSLLFSTIYSARIILEYPLSLKHHGNSFVSLPVKPWAGVYRFIFATLILRSTVVLFLGCQIYPKETLPSVKTCQVPATAWCMSSHTLPDVFSARPDSRSSIDALLQMIRSANFNYAYTYISHTFHHLTLDHEATTKLVSSQ